MKESNQTVLYVDDDPDSCELMKIMFGRRGYQVVTSADPQHGIRLARQGNFDAIILDFWMPEIDGTDVCRAIRTFNKTVPIVFFTASARKQDHDRILESGAQAVLVKPVDVNRITNTVIQLIEQELQ